MVPEHSVTLLMSLLERPGSLHQVTEVIYRHGGNIDYITSGGRPGEMVVDVSQVEAPEAMVRAISGLEVVESCDQVPSFSSTFGKRVIVMGGGAQVAMVAQGAVSEADRHNIRGERISVDTIPLVGEERLAAAVRAVARLHRARILVLAGALMGGDITRAVKEIRGKGILVICTSMAGSLPAACDLVVSDPLEAGVMAVMLIADTARFSIDKVRGRRF